MSGTNRVVVVALALAGCIGSYSGGNGSGGTGASSPGGSSPSMPGAPSSPSDPGSLPPAQPPQPGGFTQAVAPLLDQAGCTECHHPGRPIDLTRYPFMAGDPATAAKQLMDSFSNGMPPAPRDPAPSSLVSAVQAWQSNGMQP